MKIVYFQFLLILLPVFIGYKTNKESSHHDCCDDSLLSSHKEAYFHNGDYNLPTPDSLAFDDGCFFESKFYNCISVGYIKFISNQRINYCEVEGGIYIEQNGKENMVLHIYNQIHSETPDWSYGMGTELKNLLSNKIMSVRLDSNFVWGDFGFRCTREISEFGGPLFEGYTTYNSSEKLNFVRIVSFDPISKILKARFRVTFQVMNLFENSKYIGPKLENIGKKRYPSSPEFITLDDGVIHVLLKKL